LDEIDANEFDINVDGCDDDEELNKLLNSSILSNVDTKFDQVLDLIHAPIQSDDDDNINGNSNNNKGDDDDDDDDLKILNNKNKSNENEEEEEDDESGDDNDDEGDKQNDGEEMIMLNINLPPPKQEKRLKIKMRKSQTFGSIKAPLSKKFKKKVSFSIDGDTITDKMTPQQLIDDYDIEDGDLIDTKYD